MPPAPVPLGAVPFLTGPLAGVQPVAVPPGAVPPVTLPTAAGAVLAAALAGAAAGALTRRRLARLRRGADVPPPWCEAATGLLSAVPVLLWALGVLPGALLPLLLALGWLGVAASAVDLRHRRLPDALTLPALPVVLLVLVPAGLDAVVRGAAGALLLAGAHAVVHLCAPAALGAGDVKLAAPVGAALAGPAWSALPLGVLFAVAMTGAVALAGAVAGRWGRRAPVPHGPSMLAGCWAAVLFVAGSAGIVGGG